MTNTNTNTTTATAIAGVLAELAELTEPKGSARGLLALAQTAATPEGAAALAEAVASHRIQIGGEMGRRWGFGAQWLEAAVEHLGAEGPWRKFAHTVGGTAQYGAVQAGEAEALRAAAIAALEKKNQVVDFIAGKAMKATEVIWENGGWAVQTNYGKRGLSCNPARVVSIRPLEAEAYEASVIIGSTVAYGQKEVCAAVHAFLCLEDEKEVKKAKAAAHEFMRRYMKGHPEVARLQVIQEAVDAFWMADTYILLTSKEVRRIAAQYA